MTETTDMGREHAVPRFAGEGRGLSAVEDWFVREVLPLEAVLMSFLRRHCREKADADDLCQDIYVRVYEAAHSEIPASPRAFVFTTARNLLIDRIRKRQVVPMATMADLDALHIANDDPGPERAAIASDTLRRLQLALDHLPERCRQAVILKKIEGLATRDIAARMNISENTVNRHLTLGMIALAQSLYGETPDEGGVL